MLQKILTFSFYFLFFLTPLAWAPWNFELFEYNKMMLVYLLTIVITGFWIVKMIQTKKFLLKSTPLDIPLLLFLIINIVSTLTSIDIHTSIWGYYSRLNGGLISTVSYLVLYYALVSNFDKEQAVKFLKAGLFSGLVVALWAVPEHFGVSPSCILLGSGANASCWVQDVQSRVFATLGQPNWLAAYLAMLIFPTFYFFLKASTKLSQTTYYLLLTTYYLAFTFTYSRGGTLGFLAGLGVFLAGLIFSFLFLHTKGVIGSQLKPLSLVLAGFLAVNLIFGSSLTDFKLLSRFAPPPRPSITITTKTPTGTQLESGGSESGQIRLIVWKGAWEIFKHSPILGSGPETFAYAYYQFRPIEHNVTTEWDFLYNKAHNEFLNYLATTGIAGFTSYMAIIIAFVWFCIKYYVYSIKGNKNSPATNYQLPAVCLLASYISYLVQNFFSFSVVIIALFFYLFPALAFLISGTPKPLVFPKLLYPIRYTLYTILYRRPFYTQFTQAIVFVVFTILAIVLLKNYWADTIFATGYRANESGRSGRAYENLSLAVKLNPGEPFYRSELGYSAAGVAVALQQEDSTTSAQLKNRGLKETEKVLSENPQNVPFLRTAIRTYYFLSSLDKSYSQKTLNLFDKTISLAPTDAKLLYNKAVILSQMERDNEAIKELLKTIELKPNYIDAYLALGDLYFKDKQTEKALEQVRAVLKFAPENPEALEKIKEWSK